MPRLNTAVFMRPDFETAVYVGSLALKRVVDEWRDRGFAFTDLAGDSAVRVRVLEALAANDPVFCLLLGHGNETTLTGQGYDKVFWTCDSRELAGRVVYALSCITAAELGPDAVAKGCKTYIGYDKTFGWIMSVIQDPLADPYARSFFEPVLEIVRRLMAGFSAGEAYRASVDKWNEWIDYWSRSVDPAAASVVMWLVHDRDAQKLLGDGTATVVTVTPILTYAAMAVLGSLPILVAAGISIYSELTKKPPVV